MACPTIHTGENFLSGALAHIDCQARTIGSYGWSGLADPGSPVSLGLTALLTIFIALFGMRLMLGFKSDVRDGVTAMLKVGVMLTLAASWPAWRVLGYDLFIDGPGQIAHSIGVAAGLAGSSGDLASRLQNVDAGLLALNVVGSGRLGVAQGDWFQLSFARIAFLVGTLGPLAVVRLATGFLLAIGPLMAGLLLFGVTRGVFEGWVRGLVATFLSSVLLSVLLGVELSLLEPWLQDVLDVRTAQQTTLDAPVEILVMCLAFVVVCVAGLFLICRLSFHSASFLPGETRADERPGKTAASGPTAALIERGTPSAEEPARATGLAHSITENARREARLSEILRGGEGGSGRVTAPISGPASEGAQLARAGLGNTWRRPASRTSGAARRRDGNV